MTQRSRFGWAWDALGFLAIAFLVCRIAWEFVKPGAIFGVEAAIVAMAACFLVGALLAWAWPRRPCRGCANRDDLILKLDQQYFELVRSRDKWRAMAKRAVAELKRYGLLAEAVVEKIAGAPFSQPEPEWPKEAPQSRCGQAGVATAADDCGTADTALGGLDE